MNLKLKGVIICVDEEFNLFSVDKSFEDSRVSSSPFSYEVQRSTQK